MALTVTVTVTISAAHDGADTTGYRLLVDGAVNQSKPVSALSGGRIAFDYAAEVGASHAYAIEAYRDPEVSETRTVTVQ